METAKLLKPVISVQEFIDIWSYIIGDRMEIEKFKSDLNALLESQKVNLPSDEEIQKAAGDYEETYYQMCNPEVREEDETQWHGLWKNEDFLAGADWCKEWMRDKLK